ncbi:MAG: hypothetical protein RL385_1658 [Pseudomonadota bacterium]|jgi:hypothetical protein
MHSHEPVRRARRAVSICSFLLASCGSEPSGLDRAFDAGSGANDSAAQEEFGVDGAAPGSEVSSDASQTALPGPGLRLSPAATTLSLTSEPFAPVTFSLSDDGASVAGVTFSTDRPDLGAIDAKTGSFIPNGAAGSVTITAQTKGGSASTTLQIEVALVHEGDPEGDALSAGAGGIGGVGGEGGGTRIDAADVRRALDAEPVTDTELTWIYPYDGTVWPQGLPAPVLAWRSAAISPLAVRIHLEVDDAYRYDGYFAPPSAAAAGRALTHLPIPQKVWRSALASGQQMRVSLVAVGRDSGGRLVTHKPASNLKWTVAPGALKGTVYYNSYGTKLVQNWSAFGGGRFGGATLAVRGDSFDPRLVAGTSTDGGAGCRVCHTVSGDGSLLITQLGERYMGSTDYDLANGNRETPRSAMDDGKFAWAALSSDGKVALGNAGPPGESPSAGTSSLAVSRLYDVATGNVLDATGLSQFVTKAAMPTFSMDGAKVAFNFFAGPGNGSVSGNGKSLVVMDVARESDTRFAFTNPRAVYTADGSTAPGWPSFLPGGDGLVFERELAPAIDGERFMTRQGARGELWWTDLQGHAAPLDRANGALGLPTSASHPDDRGLQFEPTVAPIVAGGYAWVVFTSRRLYADIATRGAYESDPRVYDLSDGNPGGPTTKKLWVFAFDMPPKPGTDPSHPPFYLPAQELFAGNSRGFWVPDACKEAGVGCQSGDECCGGYCRSFTELGDAICTDSLPPASCSNEYEACANDGDCCDVSGGLVCIGNRCAQRLLL